MANIINQYGQVKLGVRYVSAPLTSTLWGNVFGVWNADSVGSSSLKTSLFAAYNGESNANDSFGTNNGTAQGGLTYTAGKIGNAFTFNGTNSYVSLPNNSFKFTGNFSVSFWFYCKVSGNAQTLINGYDYTGSLSGGWILGSFSTGYMEFQVYVNTQATSKSRYQVPFNTSTYNNQWVHITLTRVSSTSTKIYINGTEASGSFSKGSVADNPTYLTNCYSEIGGDFVTSGGLINPCDNGTKIDAVNVWNKELTQSEITELYNSGNGAQYVTDSFYKPTTNDALNTNNGTPQGGLTYGVGKVGTAFVFNGTTSYVRFPDNAFNSLTGSFSVSAWFKTASSISNVENYILNNISANTWFNNGNGFVVVQYGNVLNFTIYNNTNTNTELGANYTFSTNTWYHVTATKLANGNMNLYLNGSLVGTKVTSVNPTYLATVSKPCIGALNIPARGSVGYFAQSGFAVDALSTWNRELTATEVTELYNSGNGKQYPN
jgi:hypothetical protein